MFAVENVRSLVVNETTDAKYGSVELSMRAGEMIGRFKTAPAEHGRPFYNVVLCGLSWHDSILISNFDFPLSVPGVWPVANREPLIAAVIEEVAVYMESNLSWNPKERGLLLRHKVSHFSRALIGNSVCSNLVLAENERVSLPVQEKMRKSPRLRSDLSFGGVHMYSEPWTMDT